MSDFDEEVFSDFDKVGADRLADEVAVLIQLGRLDARGPAGDALLDYRDPPRNERTDRLTHLEAELAASKEEIAALHRELDKGREQFHRLSISHDMISKLKARAEERAGKAEAELKLAQETIKKLDPYGRGVVETATDF